MADIAASLADIKARIDGDMSVDLDNGFARYNFDEATLQHHMVDASSRIWGMTVLCPGQVDVASFLLNLATPDAIFAVCSVSPRLGEDSHCSHGGPDVWQHCALLCSTPYTICQHTLQVLLRL